jgi:general secretion pathway protein G
MKHTYTKRNIKAFSMMEMILVLGIITLLVGAGVGGMMNVLDLGKETKAKADLNTISSALRAYETQQLYLPTTRQGIDALVRKPTSKPETKNWKPYLKEKVLTDPWGNKYQYLRPGKKDGGGFDLFSAGADGVIGNADDIVNWDI